MRPGISPKGTRVSSINGSAACAKVLKDPNAENAIEPATAKSRSKRVTTEPMAAATLLRPVTRDSRLLVMRSRSRFRLSSLCQDHNREGNQPKAQENDFWHRDVPAPDCKAKSSHPTTRFHIP